MTSIYSPHYYHQISSAPFKTQHLNQLVHGEQMKCGINKLATGLRGFQIDFSMIRLKALEQ
jgi:hypothetical protein